MAKTNTSPDQKAWAFIAGAHAAVMLIALICRTFCW